MTEKPLTLACSECDFQAEDGNAFLDHVLVYGHSVDPGMLDAMKRDPELLRAYTQQLDNVLAHARRGDRPPGSKPVDWDNEPPEVRERLLALHMRRAPDAELIEFLEEMAARVTNVPAPRMALLEAVQRLRERGIDAFVALVNTRAENDIANGGPIEGAHHRALEAVYEQWRRRPPFPPEKASDDDVRRVQTDESNRDDTE